MSSLAPKTYMMALTAEQIEQRLLSIDNMLSKDVIRQSLSSPDAVTVPSTKAVADALTPITQTLDGLGDLASKDSVALDSNETGGVLPISKGGSGGSNLSEAQQNLGILSETQIQQLINESIPTIQQVWLDSAQVSGILPIAKGGTGSSSPAQALKNLGIHDSTGKVPVSQLPAVALTDTFPVNSQSAMLGLNAQMGDVAIRSDIYKSFILMQEPANDLANWKELLNDAEVKLTPRILESLRRSYAEAGYNLVAGSFEAGGELVNSNDVLLLESSGEAYSGPAGYVTPGTNPASNPSWVSRADLLLRSELLASGGSSLIGDASSIIEVGKIPKFSDTAGVPTLTVPDNPTKRLFINKLCTSPDDFSVVQVGRHANYSGGTAGYVGTAFQAKTYVEPTATATSEWTGLFQLDNNAPNNPSGTGPGSGALPQNVALYGQAQKRNTGSTWAGCFEINDYLNGANGAAIGIEVACSTEGADVFATPQRNGVHVAVGELVPGGTAAEWGRGFWVSTGANARTIYGFAITGTVGDSAFNNAAGAGGAASALMRDSGNLVLGVDLSAATYSSSIALRTKLGHRIAFDAEGSFYLVGNASVGGIICNSNLQINGKLGYLSANTSLTASAGSRVLPANPGGFLNIQIDGSNFRIPYYGA